MMDSLDPVAKFDKLTAESEFVFAVFYRGHWCPFCLSYLSTFATLSPSIISAGGTPVIITAEQESFLGQTRDATKYTGEAIVDTENRLAKTLADRGLLNVAITNKSGYEHGMAQPAILVLKKDSSVLESWAIVPSMMNLGGAKDRPLLDQVWENVQAKLSNKKVLPFSIYTKQKFFSVIGKKIFG
ncbi:hypothetical protein GQ53DRAFT_743452 [Thozetella sp. PMI_491]|nr:hypothetical protein GQ53DRAFT_743452 [Thozetella sp. PMI_491]